MSSYTRGRTLLTREKTLLRGLQANGTTGWIWCANQKVQVSSSGDFVAKLTVRSDCANVDGPGSDLGTTEATMTKPSTVSTAFRVNWIRVDVTEYTSGSVNADLISG